MILVYLESKSDNVANTPLASALLREVSRTMASSSRFMPMVCFESDGYKISRAHLFED
jgi:hypothetical protein